MRGEDLAAWRVRNSVALPFGHAADASACRMIRKNPISAGGICVTLIQDSKAARRWS